MNEKIPGFVAIGVILIGSLWILEAAPAVPRLLVAIWVLLSASVVHRVYVQRLARKTVTDRRRLYLELWSRTDGDLSKPEEDLVVLLGRIKGGPRTHVISLIVAIGALYFKFYQFALVISLGCLFLTAQLHVLTVAAARRVSPDRERLRAPVSVPDGVTRVVVDIDVTKVHDFIAPPAALPFWSRFDALSWLHSSGFRRLPDGAWEGPLDSLRCLDVGEIRAIRFQS
jgi:hypothetical protein